VAGVRRAGSRGALILGHERTLERFWRLFLDFGVSGFRINFFDILCTFSQISITLSGVVVVLWSSGGGCYVACGRAQKLRHAQKHHRARYRAPGLWQGFVWAQDGFSLGFCGR
jgi:hypothetical protein